MSFIFRSLVLAAFSILCLSLAHGVESSQKKDTGSLQTVRRELNESLDSLEKSISDLEKKSSQISGQAKKEWNSAMIDLRKHRDAIRADLHKTAESSKETATDFSARIKNALAELKKGIERAQSKLKKSGPAHD